MRKENYQIGDIVYFYEHWSDSIEKCKIQELKECDGVKCAEVKSIAVVDTEGDHICNAYGTSTRALQNLYPSCEEAFADYYKKSAENTTKYCEEIKDICDLLSFPLQHCLNGEEYTDYDAKAAYKQRVKELLGFEFDSQDQIVVLPENKINYVSKEKANQTIDKLIEEHDLEER